MRFNSCKLLISFCLCLGFQLGSVHTWAADHDAGDYSDLKPTDVAKAKIKHLRLLQAAVGFREVDRKAESIEDKTHEKLVAYKIKNLVPVYIDWEGRPRPWDSNHETAAIRQAGGKKVWIVTTDNFSRAQADFWPKLQQKYGISILDKKGRAFDTTLLPSKFLKLSKEDVWQDLVDEDGVQIVDSRGRAVSPSRMAEKIAELAELEFWAKMVELKKVNPYDGDGKPIAPTELSDRKIKDLVNDPYRSLGAVAEKQAGIGNLGVAMEQFTVGRFLRRKGIRFDDDDDASFDRAAKRSAKLLLSSQADELWAELGVQSPLCRTVFSVSADK
jgi:hypothetical protein